MKTRWMIAGCLSAVVAVSAGCYQTTALMVVRPAGSNDDSTDESPEDDSEPSIVQASYESADDLPAGPRIVLRMQQVEMVASPQIDAVLAALWKDDESEHRSRTIASKDISATMNALAAQGQASIRDQPAITVPSGQTGHWQEGVKWDITPAVGDEGTIQLTVAGALPDPRPGSKQALWQTQAAADLRLGETLVIEGNDTQTAVVEISRTPILGDLPLVGHFWNQRRTTLDKNKNLYLVTAEIIPASD